MKKVAAHVYISGWVQGVFFRHNTKKQADKLGISGWVRNLSDGRVEAFFEGEKEAIEKMIEWCWKGPALARVDNVEVIWSEPKGFKNFEITY